MKSLSLAAALLLAACSSASTVNPSQAIADAQTVTNGIAAVYASFVALYPSAVKPTDQTTVAADLAAAQIALSGLQGASGTLSTAATLEAVETDANAVVAVLAGVLPNVPGVPPEVAAGVEAARVLLPLIEGVVMQIQGVAVPAKMAAMGMSPAHARLVLQAVAR